MTSSPQPRTHPTTDLAVPTQSRTGNADDSTPAHDGSPTRPVTTPDGKLRRTLALEQREVNKDGFIKEWPSMGLVAMDSPADPKPSVRVDHGQIVEMDGRKRADFDFIDRFIADKVIDPSVTEKAMALSATEIAHMLVSPTISRQEVLTVSRGLTPAKLLEVAKTMNVVELMMAFQKMRARRTPANQAHTTNKLENPVLIAADAAEAALRGFRELETTLGVVRYAPLVAIALLIGSQTGRGGVLTQCALEEATTLKLGMRGLTTYAETVSVYGTEQVFEDGDDTPWSKAFLASAYASRGIKARFTSGTGSEVLMGHADGKSMLYLEIRCILVTKGAGVQGLQNGSISCIGLPGAVPAGMRAVVAENMITAMVDLECSAGNDQAFSHSKMRSTARFLPQLLAGSDLVTGGYSSVPNEDNMFAGSNEDVLDYDDWNTLQRDFQVDGGLRHVTDKEISTVRESAARALQTVLAGLELDPPITVLEDEIQAAINAFSSADMPKRDIHQDLKAADYIDKKRISGLEVVRALDKDPQHAETVSNMLTMLRQRVSGDLLQTSAILDPDPGMTPRSAVNDPNDYAGPGTGYRPSGQRWEEMKVLRHLIETHPHRRVDDAGEDDADTPEAKKKKADEQAMRRLTFEEGNPAEKRDDPHEVVIALSPGFGRFSGTTITGEYAFADILKALIAGIKTGRGTPRFIRCLHSADVAAVAHTAAKHSGSKIGVGILSRGTTVIHHADLRRLQNLELFPQAPVMTPTIFEEIGKNAALYTQRGDAPDPVPTENDYMARVKYQARAALSQIKEIGFVTEDAPPIELDFKVDGVHWKDL
ncbi:Propanediol dehydratase, large subunit [Saccharopolyspora shandongensis]|uniref:Propanediol dehydratase, large subunit n=1 Tax=Saccharopolyspora shandongensis TaxID=418495 RepID=A0A1H3Q2N8_9PSEU|nr:propanediol/glycerol family dehydratase large subunit [Saccharopolyspora shandongensis]SDZ07510.1 Propanediol dehydratase, large subunit [Saccharopolyspora shandongensis]